MLSNLKNKLESYMWKDIAENWASLYENLQQNYDSSESEFLYHEVTAKFSSFPWLFPAGMQMAQQAILQQRNAELLPKKDQRHIYLFPLKNLVCFFYQQYKQQQNKMRFNFLFVFWLHVLSATEVFSYLVLHLKNALTSYTFYH